MKILNMITNRLIYGILIMVMILNAAPTLSVQAAGVAPFAQNNQPPLPSAGEGISNPQLASGTAVTATAIAAGYLHTCILTSDTGVKCWGVNENRQLGNGSDINSNVPVDVVESYGGPVLTGVIAISAGYYHTCALMSDTKVKCWGDNSYGQLGNNGAAVDYNLPVYVNTSDSDPTPLSGVSAISAGDDHTCAIVSGGLKCWGWNWDGQIGDSTSGPPNHIRSVPVNVSGLSGVEKVSGGFSFTCGIKTGGVPMCWGLNGNGQLGDSTNTGSSVPVSVSGLTADVQTLSSKRHTCAINTSGALKCWGPGGSGQLGNSSSADSKIPVDVNGSDSWSKIAAGGWHSCAITTGGTLKCWGDNNRGQFGNNSQSSSSIPVVISGMDGMAAVVAGEYHTCAMTTDGTTIKCWGDNQSGQLGNGSTSDMSKVPVNVVGFPPVYSISGTVTWNSSALAGVTLSAGGKTATSDASGNYTLTGLIAGSYTVTPSKTGYTFSPTSTPVTITSADVSGTNFTATASTFSISGKVTRYGNALAGVTLSAGGKTAVTNSLGVYTLSGFTAGAVTVTPSKSGYTFTPSNQVITIAGCNVTSINFAANVINSQFNGNKLGWTAVKGTWTNSTTYLVSPAFTVAGSASIAYTASPSSYTKLDYSAKIYRTGCASCLTSLYVRGSGVSLSTGGWTSGYQFSITRDGRYSVVKTVASRATTLKVLTASTKINKLNTWNVLRVVAIGTSLKFYINGTLVWSSTDTALSAGKVGIGMVSNGTGGVNRMYVDYATLAIP